MQTLFSSLFFSVLAILTFSLVVPGSAYGQAVERIYGATACRSIEHENSGTPGDFRVTHSGDQSMDAGEAGDDGEYEIYCPVVRQKVGSSKGAKFYVFVDDLNVDADSFTCTMTSRRPHNGALVSSGSRTATGVTANSNGEALLARSINPSSTYGHYTLLCETNSFDPKVHGYRIREF